MTLTRTKTRTFVALVEDRTDTLHKIVSRLRQRRFLIDSLTVGQSETPGLLRLTFTLDGSVHDVKQVVLQLLKLIEVVSLDDVTGEDLLSRELALVKVAVTEDTYPAVYDVVQQFHGSIVKESPACLVVAVTGTREEIDACVDLLRPLGLKEVTRTGTVAVRGE